MSEKLEWFVYIENLSFKAIKKYNVFGSGRFDKCIKDLKSKLNKKNGIVSFKEFSEQLDKEARWCFNGRSEYEVCITNIFESKMGFKVSIYDQLQMNWNAFAEYVYEKLFGKTCPSPSLGEKHFNEFVEKYKIDLNGTPEYSDNPIIEYCKQVEDFRACDLAEIEFLKGAKK